MNTNNLHNEQMEKEALIILLQDNSMTKEMPFVEDDFYNPKYRSAFNIIDSKLSL